MDLVHIRTWNAERRHRAGVYQLDEGKLVKAYLVPDSYLVLESRHPITHTGEHRTPTIHPADFCVLQHIF